MNKEKIEYISHLAIAGAGILLFAYIFVKYLFVLLLPFAIAWGVAFSIRPIAKKLSSGTKIPYRAVSVILTLLTLIGSLAVLTSAIVYAAGEAWEFVSGLAGSDALYDVLSKIMNPIGGLLGDKEGATELEGHIGTAVQGMLSSAMSGIVSGITAFARSVPRALIFILVTVVASIYFALDLEGVNSFVAKRLPEPWVRGAVRFKNRFLVALMKYLRAYLIIMVMTFIVMLFGFLLLRVRYAVLFAFAVALLDALPLIGVGTLLLPWSIYQMLFGNLGLGIGLLVLFILHTVIREFTEPKIVGKNLGIHPILSLVLLYAGYCLFGFLGLFLIPVFTVVIAIMKSNGEENSAEID